MSAHEGGFLHHRDLLFPQITNFMKHCVLGIWVWCPQNIRLCLKGKGGQGVHRGCFHPIGTSQNWQLELVTFQLENYPSMDYFRCSRLSPSPASAQKLLHDMRPS